MRLGLVAVATALLATPGLAQAAPAVGVDNAGTTLRLFDTAAASPIPTTTLPITGLGTGEAVEGLDVRPATGALYGLGVTENGVDDALRVLRIDPVTGAATAISQVPIQRPDGVEYGFDFNPTVDRIRVVNDADGNLRLNPNSGTLAAVDANLNPAGPTVTAIAYANNVPLTLGPFGTTVFGIDSVADQLVTIGGFLQQTSPNSGGIGDGKALGVNPSTGVNLDIAGLTSPAVMTFGNNLSTISLQTGVASGTKTLPQPLDGFALLPTSRITLAGRAATATEGGHAVLTLVRSGDLSAKASVRLTTENFGLLPPPDTATKGVDFAPIEERVYFQENQSVATVGVPVAADAVAEPAETFTVALADPGPGGTGTLTSDAGPVGLGIDTGLGADAALITIVDPVPPAPPAAAPPDRVGPFALTLPAVTSARRATLAGRGLTLRYVCGEACRVTFTLKLGRRTLGTRVVRLSRAGIATTKVFLTRSAKAALLSLLKRRRTAKLTLEGRYLDARGNATVRRTTITARR